MPQPPILKSLRYRIAGSFVGASFLCAPLISAVGEPRLPALSEGMRFSEVLSLWGEPSDRIEQESKRIDVWRYPHGEQIVFSEGRIDHWNYATPPQPSKQVSPTHIEGTKISSPRSAPPQDPEALGDILNEIMKKASSDDGSGSGSQAGSPPGGGMGLGSPPPGLPSANALMDEDG